MDAESMTRNRTRRKINGRTMYATPYHPRKISKGDK